MRLAHVLPGMALILLLAGAAAAATQAGPEVQGLFGTVAALLGCPDAWDTVLASRDAVDEAEFAAVLEPWTEAGE